MLLKITVWKIAVFLEVHLKLRSINVKAALFIVELFIFFILQFISRH